MGRDGANTLESASLKPWTSPQKSAGKTGIPNEPDPFYYP